MLIKQMLFTLLMIICGGIGSVVAMESETINVLFGVEESSLEVPKVLLQYSKLVTESHGLFERQKSETLSLPDVSLQVWQLLTPFLELLNSEVLESSLTESLKELEPKSLISVFNAIDFLDIELLYSCTFKAISARNVLDFERDDFMRLPLSNKLFEMYALKKSGFGYRVSVPKTILGSNKDGYEKVFLEHDNALFVGYDTGKVICYDLSTGKQRRKFLVPDKFRFSRGNSTVSLSITQDGKLISLQLNGLVFLYDSISGEVVGAHKGVKAVATTTDGSVVFGCCDGVIRIFRNIEEEPVTVEPQDHVGPVHLLPCIVENSLSLYGNEKLS